MHTAWNSIKLYFLKRVKTAKVQKIMHALFSITNEDYNIKSVGYHHDRPISNLVVIKIIRPIGHDMDFKTYSHQFIV